MLAKDVFHNAVRVALEKDGWTITQDPLHIKIDDIEIKLLIFDPIKQEILLSKE